MPRSFLRKKLLAISAAAFVAVFAISYVAVEIASWGRTYDSVDSVPKNTVGLVLGTAKRAPDGGVNVYFAYRMAAAAELYAKGRVDCLLVSGDNASSDYNEIRDMQLSLMELGVPPERIHGDYAGFRTLDSIIRANRVFGLSRFTVVTQEAHAERALFVARLDGIEAVAFVAKSPSFLAAPMAVLREFPARILAFYDVVLGRVGPKFLGNPVRIETDPSVRPVPEKVCYPR